MTISVPTPLMLVNVHEMLCSGKARASQMKVALDPSLMVNWFDGGVAITGEPVRQNTLYQHNKSVLSVYLPNRITSM